MRQNCIFEDKIELWVLKMCVLGKKDPVLSWNVLNLTTWRGDMGQQVHF